VIDHFKMAEAGADGVFMMRLSNECYHTLIPLTDTVAYIETILGPFKGTKYAPWSPEAGAPGADEYFKDLCARVGLAGVFDNSASRERLK